MAKDPDPTRLSRNEMVTLKMLVTSGKELYAYSMVEESEGFLKHSGVYTMLTRMEDKGWVKSRKEEQREGARGRPRRLYKTTGVGKRVYECELDRQEKFQARWVPA